MRTYEPNLRCRTCGEAVRWNSARCIGLRSFCCEPCAVIWLSDAAGRAESDRIALEIGAPPCGLLRHPRLLWASWRARATLRRLNRRLDAGPWAGHVSGVWLPPPRGTAAFLLVLIAWTAAGGRAPATRAMLPFASSSSLPANVAVAPPVTTPLLSALPPPAVSVPSPAPVPSRSRPAPRVAAEDITRGNITAREIAFTFDGGAEANVAGEILDFLQAHKVHATIFLTGQFIRMFPDLVRRMVADGHEVGNHLDAHPHLTTYAENHRQQTLPGVTREFLVGQLRRAEASFSRLTGQAMAPYWRAPYGEHNPEILAWAAEAGFRHISWTRGGGTAEDLDTRDWVADRSSRTYRSREEVAARILEFGRGRPEALNGGIVLMHLASHRKSDRPHESLPQLLNTLQRQGYRLVTISELLGRAQPDQASGPAAATRLRASAVQASTQ